jgi:hypothetical protein
MKSFFGAVDFEEMRNAVRFSHFHTLLTKLSDYCNVSNIIENFFTNPHVDLSFPFPSTPEAGTAGKWEK